jgi:hypothetical protein
MPVLGHGNHRGADISAGNTAGFAGKVSHSKSLVANAAAYIKHVLAGLYVKPRQLFGKAFLHSFAAVHVFQKLYQEICLRLINMLEAFGYVLVLHWVGKWEIINQSELSTIKTRFH